MSLSPYLHGFLSKPWQQPYYSPRAFDSWGKMYLDVLASPTTASPFPQSSFLILSCNGMGNFFLNTYDQNNLFSAQDYILISCLETITGWKSLKDKSFKRSVKCTYHTATHNNQKQVYQSKKA